MPEIKNYSQWSADNALDKDPIDALREYTDYARMQYLRSGVPMNTVEPELRAGIEDKLKADGLLSEETTPEQLSELQTRLFAPKTNLDFDAAVVQNYLALDDPDSGDEETKNNSALLRDYLAKKKYSAELAAPLEGAVKDLLQDSALVRRARVAAVDRGEYNAIAVTEDDGTRNVYAGSRDLEDSEIPMVAESLVRSGALDTSDIVGLQDNYRKVFGGKSTLNQNARSAMFNDVLDSLSKTDSEIADILGGASAAAAKQDAAAREGLGGKAAAFATGSLAAPVVGIGEAVGAAMGLEKPKPTGAEIAEYQFRQGDSTAAEMIRQKLLENPAMRKRFSEQEITAFTNDRVLAQTDYKFDNTKPESGLRQLSTGEVNIAPALLVSPQKLEDALGKAPLNEDQKEFARRQRAALLDVRVPQMLKLISSSSDEAVSAYATAKQNGVGDREFVEQWLSNEDNYGMFSNTASSLAYSGIQALGSVPIGIASLLGSETATTIMLRSQAKQARYAEYGALFGDEFGLTREALTALPAVAVDIALTIGTAGVGRAASAAARAGSMSARTLAKGAVGVLDDAALAAVRGASAGAAAETSAALRAAGRSWISKAATTAVEQTIPVALPAFTRSASSTYVSIYGSLPEDMTHEEKHKQAIGFALAAGVGTAVITAGLSALGAGGVEKLGVRTAAKGLDDLTYREAKVLFETVKNEGKAVSDKAFRDALAAEVGGNYKRLIGSTAAGFRDEAFEEALDQSINMAIEDAALKKNRPLAEKLQQVWNAGLIGGVLGGGLNAASQAFTPTASAQTKALQQRTAVLDGIAKRLSTSNAPKTAASVQRMMDDANAAAAASVKKDTAAAATQAAAATTTAVRTVAEQLEFKFDDPRGVPPADTRLADLIGERVYIGDTGINGIAEIDTNTGEVVINFSKPTKVKDKPNVTRYVLGTKFQKATGVTLKPKIKTLAKPVGALPVGTRIFNINKMEFVLPTVEAVDKARAAGKPLLVLQRDEKQRVVGVMVRGASLVASPTTTTDTTITDPDLIREVLRLYPAPATPTGGFQLESGEQLELDFNAPPPAPAPTGGFALEPADQLELNFGSAPETEPELEALGEPDDIQLTFRDSPDYDAVRGAVDSIVLQIGSDPVLTALHAARIDQKGFSALALSFTPEQITEAGDALDLAMEMADALLEDTEAFKSPRIFRQNQFLFQQLNKTLDPLRTKYDRTIQIRKQVERRTGRAEKRSSAARRNQRAAARGRDRQKTTQPVRRAQGPSDTGRPADEVAPEPEPTPTPEPEPEPKPAAKKAARKAAAPPPTPSPAAKKAARKEAKPEPAAEAGMQVLTDAEQLEIMALFARIDRFMDPDNPRRLTGGYRASLKEVTPARDIRRLLAAKGYKESDTPTAWVDSESTDKGSPLDIEKLNALREWAFSGGKPAPETAPAAAPAETTYSVEEIENWLNEDGNAQALAGATLLDKQGKPFKIEKVTTDEDGEPRFELDDFESIVVPLTVAELVRDTKPESFIPYLEAGNTEPETTTPATELKWHYFTLDELIESAPNEDTLKMRGEGWKQEDRKKKGVPAEAWSNGREYVATADWMRRNGFGQLLEAGNAEPEAGAPTPEPSTPPVDPKFRKALSKFVAEYTEDSSANVEWSSDKIESKIKKALKEGYVTQVEHDEALGQLKSRELQEDDTALLASLKSKEDRKDFWESHMDNQRGQALETLYGYAQTTLSRLDPQAGTLSMLAPQDPLRPVLAIIDGDGYLLRNDVIIPDDRGAGQTLAGTELVRFPDGSLMLASDVRGKDVFLDRAGGYVVSLNQIKKNGPVPVTLVQTTRVGERTTWRPTPALTPVTPTFSSGTLSMLAPQGAAVARHTELEAKFNAGTITPEETAEAQRIVESAARAAGLERVYHGTFAGYTPGVAGRANPLTLENLKFPAFFTNSKGDPSYKSRGGLDTRRGTSVEAFARVTEGRTVGSQNQYRNYEPQTRSELESAETFTGVSLDQRFGAQGTLSTLAPQGAVSGRLPGEPTQRTGPLKQEGAMGDADTQLGIVVNRVRNRGRDPVVELQSARKNINSALDKEGLQLDDESAAAFDTAIAGLQNGSDFESVLADLMGSLGYEKFGNVGGSLPMDTVVYDDLEGGMLPGDPALVVTHGYRFPGQSTFAAVIKAGVRPTPEGTLSTLALPDGGSLRQNIADIPAALRGMLPAGFTLVADPNMDGALGYNAVTAPTTVFYNPNLVGSITIGLSRADGMATLRTAVDHELGHAAAEAEFGEEAYAALATELGEDMLTNIASIYYSLLEPDFNLRAERIKADRESGALPDWKIAAEWVRMEIERIANGRTSEQRMLFLRSRPSLLAKFIDALDAFVTRLRARFFEQPTTGTAASISNAARQLRKLKNGGYLPATPKADPNLLGHAAEFMGALERGSDQTLFTMPIGAATAAGKAQVDGLWKRIRKKFQNLPPEFRPLMEEQSGIFTDATDKSAAYQKSYERLLKKYPSASLDDIGLVLGRTDPTLDDAALARIQTELDAFAATLPADMDAEELITKKRDEVSQRERIASNTAFGAEQAAAEQRLRNDGHGEIADLVKRFRGYIDLMTEKYPELSVVIAENEGVYLMRTYRFFHTEGWALLAAGNLQPDGTQLGMFRDREIDFGKLRANAAKTYEQDVIAEAAKEGVVLTAEQLRDKVFTKLDAYLEYMQKGVESEPSPSGGTLKKDMNRLLPKGNINKAILDLLGVVEDPLENAIRTMNAVGKLAAKQTFMRGAREMMLNSGLASTKQTQTNSALALGRVGDPSVSPLGELWTTPELAQALQAEFGVNGRGAEKSTDSLMREAGRVMTKAASVATTMKTLGSIGFYPRNIVSGQVLLLGAQGILPVNSNTTKAWGLATRAYFESWSRTDEQAAAISRMIELQVLKDDTQGRVAVDMMRGLVTNSEQDLDALLDEFQEAASGNPKKLMGRLKQGAGKGYGTTVEFLAALNNIADGAVKAQAYMFELDVLKKDAAARLEQAAQNPNPKVLAALNAELEARAADKVKDTFPSHSRQYNWVKSLNQTSVGMVFFPFARWKTEVFRTMYNTPRLAIKEIREGGPAERVRGFRRMFGFLSTMAIGGKTLGLVYSAIFSALGDDEDKEGQQERKLTDGELYALREALPDWQRSHAIYTRLIGGEVQVIDLTAMTPYAQLTDIFGIAIEGLKSGEGVNSKRIASYVATQLIGTQIAASAASEVLNNRDDFGQTIYNETDNLAEVFYKSFAHYGKGALKPGAYDFYQRATRSGEQNKFEIVLGELLGARPRSHKLSEIEYRALRGVKRMLDDSAQIKSSLVTGRKLDEEEVVDTLLEHQDALNRTQRKLSKTIQGLKSMGSTRGTLFGSAKTAGFSAQRMEFAEQGKNLRWVGNQEWLKGVYQNMTRTGEDDPMNRINLLRRTLLGMPATYDVLE